MTIYDKHGPGCPARLGDGDCDEDPPVIDAEPGGMLDEAEIAAIGRHEVAHKVGACLCPCFAALIKVGEAMATESELRARLARVSPEALAAITIAGGPDAPAGAGDDVEAYRG